MVIQPSSSFPFHFLVTPFIYLTVLLLLPARLQMSKQTASSAGLPALAQPAAKKLKVAFAVHDSASDSESESASDADAPYPRLLHHCERDMKIFDEAKLLDLCLQYDGEDELKTREVREVFACDFGRFIRPHFDRRVIRSFFALHCILHFASLLLGNVPCQHCTVGPDDVFNTTELFGAPGLYVLSPEYVPSFLFPTPPVCMRVQRSAHVLVPLVGSLPIPCRSAGLSGMVSRNVYGADPPKVSANARSLSKANPTVSFRFRLLFEFCTEAPRHCACFFLGNKKKLACVNKCYNLVSAQQTRFLPSRLTLLKFSDYYDALVAGVGDPRRFRLTCSERGFESDDVWSLQIDDRCCPAFHLDLSLNASDLRVAIVKSGKTRVRLAVTGRPFDSFLKQITGATFVQAITNKPQQFLLSMIIRCSGAQFGFADPIKHLRVACFTIQLPFVWQL